jgi:hypothetical protein
MRLTLLELGAVVLTIGYIAFYTHPAPRHIADFVSSPVGSVLVLLGVLYVTVKHSFVVGVFLAIAYVLTVQQVTEYLDPKEQSSPKEPNVKMPDMKELSKILESVQSPSMSKGTESKLPVVLPTPPASEKKGTPSTPPVSTTPVKPIPSKQVEHFAPF